MTLRKKILLIIAVTFLSLLTILYFTSQNILLGSFAKLEEQNVHQNVERVLSALSKDLSSLDATAGDWAGWDDTYAFIEDANTDYIKSNLIDGTFTELNLNLMLFINSSGRTVFSKAFDLYNETEIPMSQSLQEHLSTSDLLLTHPDTESSITGLVLLPEGPMLVASQPILTSEDEGPIRGTLIMGRYLGAAGIEHLAETTHLSLIMHRFDDPQMPPDLQAARSSLSAEASILARPLDEQSIAGYALLKDIYGKPSLMLRIDMPRDIYQQGQEILVYCLWLIMIVGAGCGAVTMWILEKQVLSRLARLSKSVNGIGTNGDLSARISMTGRDELSNLADEINRMIGALERSGKALRESEEKYRNLIERANDGICIIQDTLLKYANPRLAQMGGYTIEELTDTLFTNYVHPDEIPKVVDYYKRRMAGEDVTTVYETALRHKDGGKVDVELNTGIITYHGKSADLVFIRDITERKGAEEALRNLYDEETKLRQELQTEIKRRIEFTRALVHELKTPLTPILASSDALVTELQEEPLLSLARNINRGASNLNKRIDELLDLARGEIGMLKLECRPVDPLQLLHEVIDDMVPVASNHRQSLLLDLPPHLPLVQADEDRLRQIMINLISNACKFTPEGGEITVRAKEKDADLIVEIQDTGRGITEEEQQRLFQPYHRFEIDRQRLSGLGLGLSLCKTLVELHGGRIWVESQEDNGSTFGFSVPLEAASQFEEGTETGGKL